jgi:archaellum component FlaG (FlaF/FlaG flagellin family)
LIGVASIASIWISIQNKAGNAVWIPNVNFNQSNLIVYIQNIGEDSVTLYSLYINQEKFTITLANCIVDNQQTTEIEKGQTATVTINNSYQEKIQIRVVCTDGTSNESDWKP